MFGSCAAAWARPKSSTIAIKNRSASQYNLEVAEVPKAIFPTDNLQNLTAGKFLEFCQLVKSTKTNGPSKWEGKNKTIVTRSPSCQMKIYLAFAIFLDIYISSIGERRVQYGLLVQKIWHIFGADAIEIISAWYMMVNLWNCLTEYIIVSMEGILMDTLDWFHCTYGYNNKI